jgi:hypothetical protein
MINNDVNLNATSDFVLLLRSREGCPLNMTEQKARTRLEGMGKVADLTKDIRICMLTAKAGDGWFDSRPMENRIWRRTIPFFTRRGSTKVRS